MNRGLKIEVEVEPLSDARWARIEQSLLERLEELPPVSREPSPLRSMPARSMPAQSMPLRSPKLRATPRVLWLASAATFALVAAIALVVVKPWSSVHEAISRVATEASPSHVTLGDASIDLSPESGIVIREEEHATVLVLERGEVALHIAPRPKDRPFLVDAGEVRVRVVGTEFSVRRAGVSAVVAVRKGIVEVTAHGEVARLTAGDSWPDQAAATLAVVGSSAASAAGTTNAVSVAGSPPGASDASGAPAMPAPVSTAWASAAQAPAESPKAHGAVIASHAASAHRALANGAAAAAARSTTATDTVPAASQAASAAPTPPALAVPPPEEAPPPAPNEPSSQARYEAAEQLERKDPNRALRAYTALARGSDVWAQDALFAAGRLQADRGARTDAIRLLEEYLRRFPRGPNAQDAQSLRESLR